MLYSIGRREFLQTIAAGTATWLLPSAGTAASGTVAKKKWNVLFIPVDDLRVQLGCYGAKQMISPNVDRLAQRGLVFKRAYCQQATCSPSRTSLLTGLRPDTTKVWDLTTHFRTTIPDAVTLPQLFKSHGYYCHAMGKVYHGGLDDPASWSVPHEPAPPSPDPRVKAVGGAFSEEGKAAALQSAKKTEAARQAYMARTGKKELSAQEKKKFRPRGLPYDMADVPDDQYPDGALARRAIEALNEIKQQNKEPFFLAVGFHKPHLPFVAPKRHWDLYSPDRIQLADNPFRPTDAPAYAFDNSGELRSYYGVPKEGPVGEELARKLIHGYYACVSFVDAQIGRVVDELERLGLRDNTIVILWGDHGWKLGEHGDWGKHTNYENDTNAPLIISVPGQATAGRQSQALVEFVDIYPSLAELCGLPLPEGLEGASFVPLLEDPARPWKKAAFSQFPRNVPGKGRTMGYAMRTDRHRFVEWKFEDGFRECELYDHQRDPKENTSLAKRTENAALLEELKRQFEAGWPAALPPTLSALPDAPGR